MASGYKVKNIDITNVGSSIPGYSGVPSYPGGDKLSYISIPELNGLSVFPRTADDKKIGVEGEYLDNLLSPYYNIPSQKYVVNHPACRPTFTGYVTFGTEKCVKEFWPGESGKIWRDQDYLYIKKGNDPVEKFPPSSFRNNIVPQRLIAVMQGDGGQGCGGDANDGREAGAGGGGGGFLVCIITVPEGSESGAYLNVSAPAGQDYNKRKTGNRGEGTAFGNNGSPATIETFGITPSWSAKALGGQGAQWWNESAGKATGGAGGEWEVNYAGSDPNSEDAGVWDIAHAAGGGGGDGSHVHESANAAMQGYAGDGRPVGPLTACVTKVPALMGVSDYNHTFSGWPHVWDQFNAWWGTETGYGVMPANNVVPGIPCWGAGGGCAMLGPGGFGAKDNVQGARHGNKPIPNGQTGGSYWCYGGGGGGGLNDNWGGGTNGGYIGLYF